MGHLPKPAPKQTKKAQKPPHTPLTHNCQIICRKKITIYLQRRCRWFQVWRAPVYKPLGKTGGPDVPLLSGKSCTSHTSCPGWFFLPFFLKKRSWGSSHTQSPHWSNRHVLDHSVEKSAFFTCPWLILVQLLLFPFTAETFSHQKKRGGWEKRVQFTQNAPSAHKQDTPVLPAHPLAFQIIFQLYSSVV